MKEKIHAAKIKDLYLSPEIPKKKLVSAVSSICKDKINPDEVVAILDDTIFGSAKEGIVVTKSKIFSRQKFRKEVKEIDLEELNNVFSNERKIFINKSEFFESYVLSEEDVYNFSIFLNERFIEDSASVNKEGTAGSSIKRSEGLHLDPQRQIREVMENLLASIKKDPGIKEFVEAFYLDRIVGDLFNLTSRHISEIRKYCLVSTRKGEVEMTVEACTLFTYMLIIGVLYNNFADSQRVQFSIKSLLCSEGDTTLKSFFEGFFIALVMEMEEVLESIPENYQLTESDLEKLRLAIMMPLSEDIKISAKEYSIKLLSAMPIFADTDPKKIVLEVEKIANAWYSNITMSLDQ